MGSSLAQSGDAFRDEGARMEQNDKRVRVSERTLFFGSFLRIKLLDC